MRGMIFSNGQVLRHYFFARVLKFYVVMFPAENEAFQWALMPFMPCPISTI